ncbi:MAG TPA: hypothetical protein VH601_01605 [Bryobacteraceae bacterium]|jgi:hypothetical protein
MSPSDAFEPLRSALERAGIRYAIGGHGRSFNAIYMPMAFKIDFFPAAAFALGTEELDHAIYLTGTGLAKASVPFVTPEDILLAKLFWFRSGGEASEVQWRDVQGIARSCANTLDRCYMQSAAIKLGVGDLLDKVLKEG